MITPEDEVRALIRGSALVHFVVELGAKHFSAYALDSHSRRVCQGDFFATLRFR